jgi:hypothetical protein
MPKQIHLPLWDKYSLMIWKVDSMSWSSSARHIWSRDENHVDSQPRRCASLKDEDLGRSAGMKVIE